MVDTGSDGYSLSRPTIYLGLMAVFVGLVAFLVLILYRPISTAFVANPGLNGLIIGVLALGTILSVFQVVRLLPEIRWVNTFRMVDYGAGVDQAPPRLLAPLASMMGDRGSGPMMSAQTMRSILDSIGTRLDEGREITRYMIGLLVFLGLLGTFWGLTQTISSVGATIDSLDVSSGELGTIFENLKAGLAAPLDGMGTAFSSSLFGLAGSLVLGFLDLQAGQAQNRFYTELEDWMSTMTGIDIGDASSSGNETRAAIGALERSIDRLSRQLASQAQPQNSPNALAAKQAPAEDAEVKNSIDNLATGVQSLVQHMRSEQQLLRDWVEGQGDQNERLARVMEQMVDRLATRQRDLFDKPSREPGE